LPVVGEFLETGRVPRFPTAILAAALGILAGVSLSNGLLESMAATRRELKRIAFQMAGRTRSHAARGSASWQVPAAACGTLHGVRGSGGALEAPGTGRSQAAPRSS